MLIFLPLVRYVRKKAEDERNKSLLINPNKIQGKDVVSSVKVVTFVKYLPYVGIASVNIWYIIINYLLYRFTHKEYTYLTMFFVGSISFMFYGYLSINIIDYLKYNLETLKTLFYYFVVPKGIDNLRNMRKNLVNEVNDFFEENIKNTQYENNRIIPSSKKEYYKKMKI